ncbi:gluconokinase [Sanguibacter sp. YZGR15]|uniref:Gluconokinase n=2 Tax=Sanguibacter suaedae TaxID=2795737 RepID=A0A934M8H4_9MICO|nr:gluconokinase [Sanguibacter suaedae]
MGVSGSGKSTVGALLAERLGWTFTDADDLHPEANVTKMRAGTPLDDDDRAPWLVAVRDAMSVRAAAGRCGVVACSALRRTYRDVLAGAEGRVRFVHLDVTGEVVASRVEAREDHFMPSTLVASQLDALELLAVNEDGLVVPVLGDADEVAERIVEHLGLRP